MAASSFAGMFLTLLFCLEEAASVKLIIWQGLTPMAVLTAVAHKKGNATNFGFSNDRRP